MWLIVGTTPKTVLPGGGALCSSFSVKDKGLCIDDGPYFSVERGTEALAAAAWLTCTHLGVEPPRLLLATDTGSGKGSRSVYEYLEWNADRLHPRGITFHYLFPDVDWHNRVFMAVEALEPRPLFVADAGFMYVAKMSGYADAYDLFTPDIGEMAFLADEKAPHPFYTRGFLLDSHEDIPGLLARARAHGNVAQNLLIKGEIDYIACGKDDLVSVSEPSVPAMEAIGGTGDLVTGLVTGFLAANFPMAKATVLAARTNRELAVLASPTPATPVGALLEHLGEALRRVLEENVTD